MQDALWKPAFALSCFSLFLWGAVAIQPGSYSGQWQNPALEIQQVWQKEGRVYALVEKAGPGIIIDRVTIRTTHSEEEMKREGCEPKALRCRYSAGLDGEPKALAACGISDLLSDQEFCSTKALQGVLLGSPRVGPSGASSAPRDS